MKKRIIAALAATSMLCGCGTVGGNTEPERKKSTTTAVTTAEAETTETEAETTAADAASAETSTTKAVSQNDETSQQTTGVTVDTFDGGMTREEWQEYAQTEEHQYNSAEQNAINSVFNRAGDSSKIVSMEEVEDDMYGIYYLIGIADETGSGEITYYYVSDSFCLSQNEWHLEGTYSGETNGSGDTPSAQNPVMSFVGDYSNGRGTITVSCYGEDKASFYVHWASSASEYSEWSMSGVYDESTMTVSYTDCVKITTVYDENGTPTQTTEYTDGTGTITFNGLSITWSDDMEGAADGYDFNYV